MSALSKRAGKAPENPRLPYGLNRPVYLLFFAHLVGTQPRLPCTFLEHREPKKSSAAYIQFTVYDILYMKAPTNQYTSNLCCAKRSRLRVALGEGAPSWDDERLVEGTIRCDPAESVEESIVYTGILCLTQEVKGIVLQARVEEGRL